MSLRPQTTHQPNPFRCLCASTERNCAHLRHDQRLQRPMYNHFAFALPFLPRILDRNLLFRLMEASSSTRTRHLSGFLPSRDRRNTGTRYLGLPTGVSVTNSTGFTRAPRWPWTPSCQATQLLPSSIHDGLTVMNICCWEVFCYYYMFRCGIGCGTIPDLMVIRFSVLGGPLRF